MTEDELFQRAINIHLGALANKEDAKALKNEAKELGHDPKAISYVFQSAKLHVENTFEEKTAAQRELEETYKRLTGYETDEPAY